MPSSKEDQQLPGNDGNEGENASHVDESQGCAQSSRKRALTSTAPIPTIPKKKKPVEILADKVDRVIEAMTKPLEIVTKPLEIVDNNQKVLRDAMACWNREFKIESTEIKLAFVEEWQQNPNAALQFVLLEPEDRQFLVRKKFPLGIEEGRNGRKDKDSESWEYSHDDINEFLEELDE